MSINQEPVVALVDRVNRAEARVAELEQECDRLAATITQWVGFVEERERELATTRPRIVALEVAARAVVDEYASHDVMCAICDPDWPGATPPSCSCGFDAAYNALAALLGEVAP